MYEAAEKGFIDIDEAARELERHLEVLTVDIGERSVNRPDNLKRSADYIESFYKDLGLPVQLQSYDYRGFPVSNVITEISFAPNPARRYLLGAHYDSVQGTVGADDNASAIAVQLETARHLAALRNSCDLDLGLALVSFTLEEPPVYGTRCCGSRLYAKEAKKSGERIDGMLCLEMVGYSRNGPGSQSYPFPLMYMNYPKEGNFIGIVSNFRSRGLARSIHNAFRTNPNLPATTLSVPLGGWLLPDVRRSDHAPFWDQGYKAVMITDTAFYRNPHYHKASDTMEKLDYRFMAELVESMLRFFTSNSRLQGVRP